MTHEKGKYCAGPNCDCGYTHGPLVVGGYFDNTYGITTPQGPGYKLIGEAIKRQDAVLWAAAPELLEACKALEQFESTPDKDTVLIAYKAVERARAAVKKAEGR